MRLLYKGVILLGAVLSVLHTLDYACYLWRADRRAPSVMVALLCMVVAGMAIVFYRYYD